MGELQTNLLIIADLFSLNSSCTVCLAMMSGAMQKLQHNLFKTSVCVKLDPRQYWNLYNA